MARPPAPGSGSGSACAPLRSARHSRTVGRRLELRRALVLIAVTSFWAAGALQPPDRRPARGDELTAPDDAERQRGLAWSGLMKRTWNGLDVLHCPRCGDRMRLVAAVEDQATAHKIVRRLGLATRAPPRGRPWQAPSKGLRGNPPASASSPSRRAPKGKPSILPPATSSRRPPDPARPTTRPPAQGPGSARRPAGHAPLPRR